MAVQALPIAGRPGKEGGRAGHGEHAMEGWTVNGAGPWVLTEPGKPLGTGQASPLVTGGVIPPGSEAVLRVESGELATTAGGQPTLMVTQGAAPGEPRHRPGRGCRLRSVGSSGQTTGQNPGHWVRGGHGQDSGTGTGQGCFRVPDEHGHRDALGGVPASLIRIGDSYEEWLTALGLLRHRWVSHPT